MAEMIVRKKVSWRLNRTNDSFTSSKPVFWKSSVLEKLCVWTDNNDYSTGDPEIHKVN
jgi:hypothetical protein